MTDLRQYDPLKVVGSFTTPGPFGVVDILDGRVAEDFAAVVRDSTVWVREFDQAGNATRVRVNNDGGQITITLAASSPTNTRLSGVVALDRAGENQVGVLSLRDLNGNTEVIAEGAFIASEPDPTFGAERGSRSWVWECQKIQIIAGGHDLA